MGQYRPLFMFIFVFSIDKSIDGVLGIGTWGGRMESKEESTQLWWHPFFYLIIR